MLNASLNERPSQPNGNWAKINLEKGSQRSKRSSVTKQTKSNAQA